MNCYGFLILIPKTSKYNIQNIYSRCLLTQTSRNEPPHLAHQSHLRLLAHARPIHTRFLVPIKPIPSHNGTVSIATSCRSRRPNRSLTFVQIASLKKQLRNRSALLGDGVSRAFLRALVQLIGGYRDALRFQPGEKVTFDQEKFIETRPISLQPFLREMLNLQIFRQVGSSLSAVNQFKLIKYRRSSHAAF